MPRSDQYTALYYVHMLIENNNDNKPSELEGIVERARRLCVFKRESCAADFSLRLARPRLFACGASCFLIKRCPNGPSGETAHTRRKRGGVLVRKTPAGPPSVRRHRPVKQTKKASSQHRSPPFCAPYLLASGCRCGCQRCLRADPADVWAYPNRSCYLFFCY